MPLEFAACAASHSTSMTKLPAQFIREEMFKLSLKDGAEHPAPSRRSASTYHSAPTRPADSRRFCQPDLDGSGLRDQLLAGPAGQASHPVLVIGSRLCSTLPSEPAWQRRPCVSLTLQRHPSGQRIRASKLSNLLGAHQGAGNALAGPGRLPSNSTLSASCKAIFAREWLRRLGVSCGERALLFHPPRHCRGWAR
jgi:hypothetical protein